jgi:hypothetical protein
MEVLTQCGIPTVKNIWCKQDHYPIPWSRVLLEQLTVYQLVRVHYRVHKGLQQAHRYSSVSGEVCPFAGTGIAQPVEGLDYGVDDWGSMPSKGREGYSLFTTVSILSDWPAQLPIQWTLGDFFMGMQHSGHEADHLPSPSAEVSSICSTPSTTVTHRKPTITYEKIQ